MKKFLAFFLASLTILCLSFASAETAGVTAAAPSGAPGVALALLASKNPDAYTFLSAETIPAEFANENSDFIIAPLNAGAKLYKAGKSTYRLAAVVTWGNLYIASQKPDFKLEDINGAALTLFGENTINASIVLYSLEKAGITPASTEYLAGAANTQSLLLSDAEAIVVTAEPAITAAKVKNEAVTAYAVNDLYKTATGYDGFTQAGLFVKAATAEASPELVAAFLDEVKASCDACTTDLAAVADAAVALELLPNAKIATAAIPGCSIHYMNALDAKEQIEATVAVAPEQFGGVPSDDFYYEAK